MVICGSWRRGARTKLEAAEFARRRLHNDLVFRGGAATIRNVGNIARTTVKDRDLSRHVAHVRNHSVQEVCWYKSWTRVSPSVVLLAACPVAGPTSWCLADCRVDLDANDTTLDQFTLWAWYADHPRVYERFGAVDGSNSTHFWSARIYQMQLSIIRVLDLNFWSTILDILGDTELKCRGRTFLPDVNWEWTGSLATAFSGVETTRCSEIAD